MNIIVCIKQVLDPEIPARDFRVDPQKRQAERGSANMVMDLFCENALETALLFRDAAGAGKITALAFGPAETEDALRKALAMKADEAVLVVHDGPAHPDPLSVATVLAAAIKKLDGYDLVLLGRESADWGAGQTAGLVAEELGIGCLAFVDTIETSDAGVVVRRQTELGWERFEANGPFVASITNAEHNVPRIPKTRDVMLSYRKPLTKWTLADLGLAGDFVAHPYYEIAELSMPKKETVCEFVDGESLDDRIEAFARRIADVVRSI